MSDSIGAVFAALADPTRRAIVERLAHGDASVTELAEPFAISQPAVSKHLRVLENAGLITRTRVATTRYSSLRPEPLREAAAWVERYRGLWNDGFDRLDALLAADRAASPTGAAAPNGAASSTGAAPLPTDSSKDERR
ncbi:helix-turn-helix transcriptional regulator [Herbiconiux sp. L3-i23]|uniref:ArsR/SmtB family transcription factor n=1 Tax=Herbiconiux sp. L3-i23 TaxID=2905871 RepID=UPI00205B721E|nr:metalloregulator ArsR/SmtB family transcription factor [Herbiconiux sp. L3-i23]BDI23939.1 hypothetical protein L3i23_27150 [Herbiconiux sp. L3-i23]